MGQIIDTQFYLCFSKVLIDETVSFVSKVGWSFNPYLDMHECIDMNWSISPSWEMRSG